MWEIIQADEKVKFLEEYRDDEYGYDDIVFVDLAGRLNATRIDDTSVSTFMSDDVVVLVRVD